MMEVEACGSELRSRVRTSRLLDSSTSTLVPGIVHGLTGRVPGMGLADGNIGFSPPRDKADAWDMRRRWCALLGLDPERLVTSGQVHGADVIRVTAADAGRGAWPGSQQVGFADALITDEPDVILLSLHADCLPLLLVDPERPAIAAVHAGWRGTVLDVAGATIRAMAESFGSHPDRLLAYLGPAIGPCCYEVGPEVVAGWLNQARAPESSEAERRQGDNAIAPHGNRHVLDLWTANEFLLRRAGMEAGNMETDRICTRCNGDAWFSHRGQGPATGRHGALIALQRKRDDVSEGVKGAEEHVPSPPERSETPSGPSVTPPPPSPRDREEKSLVHS